MPLITLMSGFHSDRPVLQNNNNVINVYESPKDLHLQDVIKIMVSQIPCTIKTDTQSCSVGLADTKLGPFNDTL